ncbi:MAG: glycosyltransferase, partial [Candidatus Omnitrophica bacterium]|nr:glycosyltransferase [Candidatus Omnitrophota bacterium]
QTLPAHEIIVVDNASVDSSLTMMKEEFPSVCYVRLNANLGSAGGFYEGIQRASENNDLVWLLDDDVSVSEDALEKIVHAQETLAPQKKLGAVRSWCVASRAPSLVPWKTVSFAWRGTLIPIEVIKDIGLPRKEYFLYAEDTEYSLRMRKKGYDIYWVPTSRVIEQRGSDREHIRFSCIHASCYRSKERIYYSLRNEIAVYKEYCLWGRLCRAFLYAAKLIFLLNLKGVPGNEEKIISIRDALSDGIKGKPGVNQKYLIV